MENNENTTSYLVIGGIIAVVIAYYIGFSGGKEQTTQELAKEYSHNNEEYSAMEACYHSVLEDKEEIKSISQYKGDGDGYDELVSAISEIDGIVAGHTISVPKVPNHPESGYYDCE